MVNEFLSISIIYADSGGPWQVQLQLPAGATVAQALSASEFARHFPNYPMDDIKLGIYGQQCDVDRELGNGDRIEIYRTLTFDPMESRRRRARHRQAFMVKPHNTPRRRNA